MTKSVSPAELLDGKVFDAIDRIASKSSKFKDKKEATALLLNARDFTKKFISEHNEMVEFYGKKTILESGDVSFSVDKDELEVEDNAKYLDYMEHSSALSSRMFSIENPVVVRVSDKSAQDISVGDLLLVEGFLDVQQDGDK